MRSDARRRMIAGPVGSGKSSGSVVEIARRGAQQRPDPRTGKRHTRFAVVRNTNRELKDTTIKTFFDWFPPGVAGSWHETNMTFKLQVGDIDCEVLFRPLDTADDVKRLLSLELTGAYVNEGRELPREIYEGLDSRIGRYPSVRNGGCTWRGLWADTNMPEEESYCYRILEGFDLETGDPSDDNGWEAFTQPSGRSPRAENVENLDPGYYDHICVGKTDEWVRVYVDCHYGRSKGGKPVYSLFNRELHVAKKTLIANRHLKLVLGADAGLTPAVLFLQRSMKGQLLVLSECYHMNCGSKRFIKDHLKPHIRAQGYEGLDMIVAGDPAMTQRSQSDEKTVKDTYKEAGFKIWTPNTNALTARVTAIDNYLAGITEDGPALLVSPECRHFIRAAEGGYRYPIRKDGRTVEEPEKNEWSHIAEAGQYGAMYHGEPEADKGREEQRKIWLAQARQGVLAGAYSRRS